eukprot:9896821-Alexandrium_andersonii.AAC.1
MSASLVGSEMCIRDSLDSRFHRAARWSAQLLWRLGASSRACMLRRGGTPHGATLGIAPHHTCRSELLGTMREDLWPASGQT